MAEPAWSNEYYHQDENFELLLGEKRSNGRLRQTRQYAAALARSSDWAAQSVATKLRSCTAFHRCGEGICPQCMTAEKRRFLAKIEEDFGRTPLSSITIIPTDARFCRLSVPTIDIDNHTAFLKDIWAAAGLTSIPMITGFDVSLEIFTGCVDGSMWSGHWHGLVPAEDETVIKSRLGYFLPKTLLVAKPLLLKKITQTPNRAFSYRFKTLFDVHHRHIQSPRRRHLVSSEIIRTTHQAFPELACLLSDIGLTSRIIHLGGQP